MKVLTMAGAVRILGSHCQEQESKVFSLPGKYWGWVMGGLLLPLMSAISRHPHHTPGGCMNQPIMPLSTMHYPGFLKCLFVSLNCGTSLAVQWLRLHTSTVGGVGSIPDWGTRILHATWCSQKMKKKLVPTWGLIYRWIK